MAAGETEAGLPVVHAVLSQRERRGGTRRCGPRRRTQRKVASRWLLWRTLTQEYQFFKRLLVGLSEVGVQPPVWCFLALTEVKGARIPTDDHFPDEHRNIDRDLLLLPEKVIDDFSIDSATILRPMFDLVWNASGFTRSFNFDANGNWSVDDGYLLAYDQEATTGGFHVDDYAR